MAKETAKSRQKRVSLKTQQLIEEDAIIIATCWLECCIEIAKKHKLRAK